MMVVVVAAEFVFIVITCGSKIEYVRLLYARSEDHKYVKAHIVNFIPKKKKKKKNKNNSNGKSNYNCILFTYECTIVNSYVNTIVKTTTQL